MMRYCLGFCFDLEGRNVAMVLKKRPEIFAGKWNGIGGKLECAETPAMAMQREFREEAFLDILDWKLFLRFHGPEYIMHVFTHFTNDVFRVKQTGDEAIRVIPVHQIWPAEVVESVRWLIPMGLERRNSDGVYTCAG